MKKIILAIMFIASVSYGQVSSKEVTVLDGNFDIVCLGEFLEVAVSDTGTADTVLVYYPITTITGTTAYALIGSIKELATNNNVVGLYGDADSKAYMLWIPSPRAVRFVLSGYASGSVFITTVWK